MATRKAAGGKGAGSKKSAKGQKNVGERYLCDACGLAVTVDESCCCQNPCDLLCCDMPMKKKGSSK